MPIKYISHETRWYDNGKPIDVPAGESIMAITCDQIPTNERTWLRRCVESSKAMGKIKVPIKIRDWYAIIEAASLTDHYVVLDVEDKSKFEKRGLTTCPQ